MRKYSMVRGRPSSSDTLGSQPSNVRARVTLDYVRPINGETDTTDDVSYVVELTDTPGEFLVSNIEGGL